VDTLGELMWKHAQSVVQAELDLETLEEALEVAEAEMSTVTLLERLRDSLGQWITCANAYASSCSNQSRGGVVTISGQMIEISRDGRWMHLRNQKSIYLRVDTLERISGLACVASSDHPQSSSERTVGSWLRELAGSNIRINSSAVGHTGQLVRVGSDFLEIVESVHHLYQDLYQGASGGTNIVVPLSAIYLIEEVA
jgi:hypothetical protein